ncbi:MAG TPA: SMR domain protein, partial [Rhodanobacter sp.]|nr:SMR domain protein [Rhodanobacter sp.]
MKRRAPAPVTDADARLFREAVGEVRRMATVATPHLAPRPAPRPRMLEADEAAVPGELLDLNFDPATIEIGEELGYLHDGYPPKVLRALKR